MRTGLLKMIAGVVLATTTIALTPGVALASVQTFEDVETARCLYSNGLREVHTVEGCPNSLTHWDVTSYSGYVQLQQTEYVNQCLDSNASRHVYTNPCGNGSNPYQLWQVLRNNSFPGSIEFKNKQTGYCLDSNANGTVYTNPCGPGNTYQQWI